MVLIRKNVEYFVRPSTREILLAGSHPSRSSAQARSGQCVPTGLVSFFFTLKPQSKAAFSWQRGWFCLSSPVSRAPLWELLCLSQGPALPCPARGTSSSQPGFAAPATCPGSSPGNYHGSATRPSFGQEFFRRGYKSSVVFNKWQKSIKIC